MIIMYYRHNEYYVFSVNILDFIFIVILLIQNKEIDILFSFLHIGYLAPKQNFIYIELVIKKSISSSLY